MKFDYEKFRKDFIIARMVDRRLNMLQASKEIGISNATVQRVETGYKLNMDSFCKIATWMDKEAGQYFYNETETKTS